MEAYRNRALGFGLHAVTWCGLLAVLGLFAWLNLDCSCNTYIEKHPSGWRGGLRQGFPVYCWDSGIETVVFITPLGPAWRSTPYGGWQGLGVAANLAAFAAAAALTALLCERAVRAARSRRAPATPPVSPSW